MEAVNWLLVNGANALLWLWGLIESVFGATFAAVDAFLDPILAPVLGALNPICSAVGDVVYAVLSPLPVWAGLTVLSAVAGVCMLIAFRFFSDQAGIGRARDDIKANLLALKLYKDDLRVTFQAQARLLRAILRLQRYVLTPVLVMLPPMLLGLAQMGVRYQWRPLCPGEQTNIAVTLNAKPEPFGVGPRLDSHMPPDTEVRLEPNPGVKEAVDVPGGGRVVWRILAGEPGRQT